MTGEAGLSICCSAGVLIVTNAEPSSVPAIRSGVAVADRDQLSVTLLSVLDDPGLDWSGMIDTATGLSADVRRHQVRLRVVDAVGDERQLPIHPISWRSASWPA
jgi:hypothetical protein